MIKIETPLVIPNASLDANYVKKPSDTMGGTLAFTDTYEPSPASSAVEPAIRARRDIIITSGHRLIFDGA